MMRFARRAECLMREKSILYYSLREKFLLIISMMWREEYWTEERIPNKNKIEIFFDSSRFFLSSVFFFGFKMLFCFFSSSSSSFFVRENHYSLMRKNCALFSLSLSSQKKETKEHNERVVHERPWFYAKEEWTHKHKKKRTERSLYLRSLSLVLSEKLLLLFRRVVFAKTFLERSSFLLLYLSSVFFVFQLLRLFWWWWFWGGEDVRFRDTGLSLFFLERDY